MTQPHINQTTIRSPFLHALFDFAPRIGLTARLVIPPVFRRRKTQWEEDQTWLNKDEIRTPFVKELSDKGSKNKHSRSQCYYADLLSILLHYLWSLPLRKQKNKFRTSMKRLAGKNSIQKQNCEKT